MYYKKKKKISKAKRITDSISKNKLRLIVWNALGLLKAATIDSNLDRFDSGIERSFVNMIISAASKAEHIVVRAVTVDECDHVHLKRKNGTFLAIAGGKEAYDYSKNPKVFRTVEPEWKGWRTNRHYEGRQVKNNGFLSYYKCRSSLSY